MDILIRPERESDYAEIEAVVQAAFEGAPHTDGTEHLLVGRLRKTPEYIPELSLVALCDDQIVGYLMLSKIAIDQDGKSALSLALAPVAVLPAYQGQGIGSRLIRYALALARKLEYPSAIVLGSDAFYPNFGFQPAARFGVKAPFDVPSRNFMALELAAPGLSGVSGVVRYSPAFFEES